MHILSMLTCTLVNLLLVACLQEFTAGVRLSEEGFALLGLSLLGKVEFQDLLVLMHHFLELQPLIFDLLLHFLILLGLP